jgi:Siphovirus Gp157
MSEPKLYEIAGELVAINELLDETGGELTPEVEARLDLLTGDFDFKAERICQLIDVTAGLATSAGEVEKRARALRQARENKVAGLKRYLQQQMERAGRPKIHLPSFLVWTQWNGRPTIRWTQGTATLPPEYRRVTIEPDYDRAYNEWRAKVPLPEGFEVELGLHLRIR